MSTTFLLKKIDEALKMKTNTNTVEAKPFLLSFI